MWIHIRKLIEIDNYNWYKCKNGIFLIAHHIFGKPLFVFEFFTVSDVDGTSLVKFCFRAATAKGTILKKQKKLI